MIRVATEVHTALIAVKIGKLLQMLCGCSLKDKAVVFYTIDWGFESLQPCQIINHRRVEMNIIRGTQPVRNYIAEKTHRGTVVVPVDEIYYIQADTKYVKVVHKGGELIASGTLKDFESLFGGMFIRTHRSCLVAASQVKYFDKTVVKMFDCQDLIAVSRSCYSSIRAFFNTQMVGVV